MTLLLNGPGLGWANFNKFIIPTRHKLDMTRPIAKSAIAILASKGVNEDESAPWLTALGSIDRGAVLPVWPHPLTGADNLNFSEECPQPFVSRQANRFRHRFLCKANCRLCACQLKTLVECPEHIACHQSYYLLRRGAWPYQMTKKELLL